MSWTFCWRLEGQGLVGLGYVYVLKGSWDPNYNLLITLLTKSHEPLSRACCVSLWDPGRLMRILHFLGPSLRNVEWVLTGFRMEVC